MTPNEARKEIYMRFVDQFTTLDRTRITFDNEKFNEPDDGEWVRIAVRHEVRIQDTLGKETNRRFRSSGSVFAQVFTEAGSRMAVADSISNEISDVFDAVNFNGLTFTAASYRESGTEGKWNMVLVEAPFSYEQIK